MKIQPSWTDAVLRRFRRITASTTFIPQIDGLRFVALSAVLLYHLRGFIAAKSGIPFVRSAEDDWLGQITLHAEGVRTFFVLSGFVLSLPFAARAFKKRPFELKRYLLRRLTRMEPLYFVVMTLFFGLLCLVNRESPAVLLPHLLAGFGYFHNIIYGEGNLVNGVAWSLEVEVQFYLLMPILGLVFHLHNRWVRRGIMVVAAVALITWQHYCVPQHGALSVSALNFLQLFLMGMIIADVYLVEWSKPPLTRYLWDIIGVASWISLEALQQQPMWASMLAPAFFLPAFGACFRGQIIPRILANRWITAIGGMCYSIYLIHYQVISAVGRFTVPFAVTRYFWVNLLVQTLIVAPFVLLVASGFYLLIERPCMREHWPRELMIWLRGLSSGGRSRPVAATVRSPVEFAPREP